MTTQAHPITCNSCGILFHVPQTFDAGRRHSGKEFFCPNGHSLVYNRGKSEADRLREELSRERQRVAQWQDDARAKEQEAEELRRSQRGLRSAITRMKTRASKGVCPCCNRTFASLARHMATKHPGFVAEPIEPAAAAAKH